MQIYFEVNKHASSQAPLQSQSSNTIESNVAIQSFPYLELEDDFTSSIIKLGVAEIFLLVGFLVACILCIGAVKV